MFTPFRYRAFFPDERPGLELLVTENMLPAQAHLLPALAAIERRMAGGSAAWRLHLRIEESNPFDIEFTSIHGQIGLCRVRRPEIECLVVMVPESADRVTISELEALKECIRSLCSSEFVEGAFDWITGLPAPLVAACYLTGTDARVGMDLLAMCLADRFFRSFT